MTQLHNDKLWRLLVLVKYTPCNSHKLGPHVLRYKRKVSFLKTLCLFIFRSINK
jgi:hypothetical protein